MEAFSLLKYWRGGGGGGGLAASGGAGGDSGVNARATTIIRAVTHNTVETDDDDDDDDDDDGPFFDLEFAAPDEEDGEEQEGKKDGNDGGSEEQNEDVESSDEDDDAGTDGEKEFNLTLSPGSSNDRTDRNLALSPSDDLFFKGRLVPIESSSMVVSGAEHNAKQPQFPVSLLKSATKFRVFMLGFKKSMNNYHHNTAEKINEKSETEANGVTEASASPKQQQQKQEKEEDNRQSKFFSVKLKVEEVPIVSLFTRENSKSIKLQKQNNNNNNNNNTSEESVAAAAASSDEKQRFSKDVMQKYLKKVKPLYIRVSKRYGEKLRFSGQLTLASALKTATPSPSTATAGPKSSPVKFTSAEKSQQEKDGADFPAASNLKSVKQGNLPAGLRVVCKHLGKSRSASSAAVAVAPPGPVVSKRRDDSLLQQQDGIQSAILHCKRSFNASRDSESSLLSRSVSDPSHEKSTELSRKPSDHEGNGSSLSELKTPKLKNK